MIEDIEMDVIKVYDNDYIVVPTVEEDEEDVYIEYHDHYEYEDIPIYRTMMIIIIGLEFVYELFNK